MKDLLSLKIAGTAVIFASIVFCCAIPSQAQTTYTVTDLGAAANGAIETNASDINNRGVVAAATIESFFPVFEEIGFVSQNGQVTLLPSLGGQFTFAAVINDSGIVAGSANLAGDTIGHASIWDRDLTHVTDLGTLGGSSSAALWLNESNQVVGDSGTANGVDVHAFLWDRGKLVDLGALGGSTSFATGINNSGLIVGQSDTSTVLDPVFGIPTFHGFRWDRGVLKDLGEIFGGHFNYAESVNDRGDIVGGADLAGDLTGHAFIIRNGSIIDLGTVPGDTNSAALGLNNRGQVVGISSLSFSPPPSPPVDNFECPCHAVIWQDGKATDLNTLIPSNSGWQLINAVAINDRGLIVGSGGFNNESRAFLLTPRNGPAAAGTENNANANPVSVLSSPSIIGMSAVRVTIVNGRPHAIWDRQQ
jgi:probable HAF family extracellular repeat protein